MAVSSGTWNESLSVGVPLIDMQHKQLLDQMDLLLVAFNTKKDTKQIVNLLMFLDMYVNNHLGYEEQCMHLKQCPIAAQNKAAHEHFKVRLKTLRAMLDQPTCSGAIAQQVLTELQLWFLNHIRSLDVRLRACK